MKPTWQTSTAYGGESSRAVDGQGLTLFSDLDCARTDHAPAIWGVDLGESADIYHVEVLNRIEGFPGKWLLSSSNI